MLCTDLPPAGSGRDFIASVDEEAIAYEPNGVLSTNVASFIFGDGGC